MQNRNPTNPRECKTALKFLDYLRKSQCTQLTMFIRDGAQPANNSECSKTLEKMEKLAKQCMDRANEITPLSP